MESNMENKKEIIKNSARELGFDKVSFCNLDIDKEDKKNIVLFARKFSKSSWGLHWFRKNLHFRLNPKLLHPQEGQGAIVLLSYYRDISSEEILKKAKVRIARYAHGRADYHTTLRKKGKLLLKNLQKILPELKGRVCVDSAPVPEKILARKAGLGWIGKNTNLIHPDLGSYFFISVIIVNIDFTDTEAIFDHCKNCELCIKACPTQALSTSKPFGINPLKCISYLNIEHERKKLPDEKDVSFNENSKFNLLNTIKKNESPLNKNTSEITNKQERQEEELPTHNKDIETNFFHSWAFGCDICQEVCPYNRNKKTRFLSTKNESFLLQEELIELMEHAHDSKSFNKESWSGWVKHTALSRISLSKMQENMYRAIK